MIMMGRNSLDVFTYYRAEENVKGSCFLREAFLLSVRYWLLLINSVTFSSHPVNAITRFEVSNLVFTVINNNNNNNKE
jgi:hypothetical protein